jgi:hypothetical protein
MLRPSINEARCRHAMTLLELIVAMTVMTMVVGALGGLARTVQQSFEYSEGYGTATQHARVVLDRIAKTIGEATASNQFPGCILVAETVNSVRYPNTLVVWHPKKTTSNPDGTAANPNGLPRYSELVIYCPNPRAPNQLLEIKDLADSLGEVPAVTETSRWQDDLTAIKNTAAASSPPPMLTSLLYACPAVSGAGTALGYRGAIRFETRLRPETVNCSASEDDWKKLPWVQGIYGSETGLRQVWVRMELQFVPGMVSSASDSGAVQAVPFFGSATLYYVVRRNTL